jgi:hypothetical protein
LEQLTGEPVPEQRKASAMANLESKNSKELKAHRQALTVYFKKKLKGKQYK